ncbi:MAG: M48 family metalloprotease [Candidatus Aminicenantales bacterium]
MKAAKWTGLGLFLLTLGIFFTGCSALQQGAGILGSIGTGSAEEKSSLVKVGKAIRSSFSEITEEEEFYIGRAVAAIILSRYSVYNNNALTQYVNIVGNSVACFSDRPEIYAGYHFLILDSEEVNALAAPGGFVFITKGLLRRCQDEEMLASILAHEIGHISAKHGLQSIKKSRLVDAFKIIGQEAVEHYGPEKLAKLTDMFEGVLGDIVEKLIERGYDRKYEYAADILSVKCAAKTGFDPNGIVDFLQTMVDDSSQASGKGWFKTHPTPAQRMERIENEITALQSVPRKEDVRTKRFRQFRNLFK